MCVCVSPAPPTPFLHPLDSFLFFFFLLYPPPKSSCRPRQHVVADVYLVFGGLFGSYSQQRHTPLPRYHRRKPLEGQGGAQGSSGWLGNTQRLATAYYRDGRFQKFIASIMKSPRFLFSGRSWVSPYRSLRCWRERVFPLLRPLVGSIRSTYRKGGV